ncbi:hypothetical protein WJX72_000199 [[Myrmecia] bisecta]|uniref:Uncharacterized protein n=1 Tax=[Myrmecia] bisecta TaxID=41462 RepID=A0AAW1P9D5_9CHLO
MLSAMPVLTAPASLASVHTDCMIRDALPLVTMLLCLPTLQLFVKSGRYLDLVCATTGFALATLYHLCHMLTANLQQAQLLGVSGPAWRTLDVLFAQWLLGRTFGHLMRAKHSLTKGLANFAFPVVVALKFWADPSPALPAIARSLAVITVLTGVSKVALEGPDIFQQQCSEQWNLVLGLFVASFVSFAMPELYPCQYWFYHSLWHVLLGLGYFELYCMLEGQDAIHAALKSRAAARKAAKCAAGHVAQPKGAATAGKWRVRDDGKPLSLSSCCSPLLGKQLEGSISSSSSASSLGLLSDAGATSSSDDEGLGEHAGGGQAPKAAAGRPGRPYKPLGRRIRTPAGVWHWIRRRGDEYASC